MSAHWSQESGFAGSSGSTRLGDGKLDFRIGDRPLDFDGLMVSRSSTRAVYPRS